MPRASNGLGPLRRSATTPKWVWNTIGAFTVLHGILLTLSSIGVSRSNTLLLPLSTPLKILSLLLPISSLLAFNHALYLTRHNPTKLATFRTTLYSVIFIILDTILAVISADKLSGTNTCELNGQWQDFWRNHDGGSVKAIQDRLQCCGFKTVKDRAWPFDDAGHCVRETGRTQACAGLWVKEEHRVVGMWLGVGVVLGVVKLMSLIWVNREDLRGRKSVIEEAREEARRAVPERLIEEIGEDDEDEDQGRGGVRRLGQGGVVNETTGLLDGEQHSRSSEGNVWRQ